MNKRGPGNGRLDITNIGKELEEVTVLRSLPRAIVTDRLPHCRVLSVLKNGTFFSPGDPPSVCVLVRGRVSVVARPSPEIETRAIAA